MSYIPQQGDIIHFNFNPQSGHEQQGKRPAIVISNKTFNEFTGMSLVCPITNTNKGFPLHVRLDERIKTTGVVLCEQVKSLDFKARGAAFLEKAPTDIFEEILDIIIGFME